MIQEWSSPCSSRCCLATPKWKHPPLWVPPENFGRNSSVPSPADVCEAGKWGEGFPLASTLFSVTTTRERKYWAALSSAEQFLLKEDIFFPEGRQTPEPAVGSPQAGQPRQARAAVVCPPPGKGDLGTKQGHQWQSEPQHWGLGGWNGRNNGDLGSAGHWQPEFPRSCSAEWVAKAALLYALHPEQDFSSHVAV